MTNIISIENMTTEELVEEINNGGRFVQYAWCISILIMTFKQPTDIYFIRANESATKKGISYSLLTFFLGWWGIPWGPIYSLLCLGRNLSGGYDLTDQFLAAMLEEANQGETAPQVEELSIENAKPAITAIEDKLNTKPKEPFIANPNGPVIQRRKQP